MWTSKASRLGLSSLLLWKTRGLIYTIDGDILLGEVSLPAEVLFNVSILDNLSGELNVLYLLVGDVSRLFTKACRVYGTTIYG